jgi:hypothetical protein
VCAAQEGQGGFADDDDDKNINGTGGAVVAALHTREAPGHKDINTEMMPYRQFAGVRKWYRQSPPPPVLPGLAQGRRKAATGGVNVSS